jgi:hypothetical protein
MSALEVSVHIGREKKTVVEHIRNLRSQGLIYIGKWERQVNGKRGPIIPIYFAGQGRDAPKIKPLDKMEIQRRYRSRHKGRYKAMLNPTEYTKLGVWRGLI